MKGGGGGFYGAQAQQKQFREAEDSFFYEELQNTSSQISSNNVNGDFWMKLPSGERPDEDQIIFQGRLWQKSGKHKKWTPYHFELYSNKLIRVDLSVHKQSDASQKKEPPTGNTDAVNTNNNLTSASTANNNQLTSVLSDNKNPGGGDGIGQPNGLHKENSNNKDNTNNVGFNNNNFPNTNATSNNLNDEELIAEFIPINQCFLKKIKYSDNSYSNYKYGIRLQRGEYKSELFTENSDTFNKWHDEIKRYCILPKFNKKYKALTKLKLSAPLPNSMALFKCFKQCQQCLKKNKIQMAIVFLFK